MSAHSDQRPTGIFLAAAGLVLLPYLGVIAAFWFMQQSAAPFFDLQDNASYLVLLALVGLGLAGIVAAAFMLRKHLNREPLQDPLAMQDMNEQFIEAGKMASIGELAAGIAHEINNPVAIMVEEAGWLDDLLQDDPEMAKSPNFEELKRALTQIRTQGARCKEITHKMLSFARKSDLRMQNINVNTMIQEVAALSEKRARYANSRIELALAQDIPPITASASEMQQIFLNLINNAVDAMENKGGEITITTSKSKNMVEIQIADTGAGIPKANLARIFDPFYTTKPVGKGTGLGLSICYTIIKNMGGEINVASQVDVGTTFTIRLPVTEAKNHDQKVAGSEKHSQR
ncbi:MAG TPA: GHKL domain-containing protein [Desulfonatronum sp.]|nr:GHKL domain-containing protein [Desulfonatronum sp.]